MPSGASEASRAPTSVSLTTSPSKSWNVADSLKSSPAHPPTRGTVAPITAYAPRMTSSWSPASASLSRIATWYGCSSKVSASDSATSSPASRSRVEAFGAAAVRTAKPGPPKAVTTTLEVAARPVAISPAVVQPISGVPGARREIADRSCGRSYESEQKTTSSLGSSPASAAETAAEPAANASGSAEWPTAAQRRADGASGADTGGKVKGSLMPSDIGRDAPRLTARTTRVRRAQTIGAVAGYSSSRVRQSAADARGGRWDERTTLPTTRGP